MICYPRILPVAPDGAHQQARSEVCVQHLPSVCSIDMASACDEAVWRLVVRALLLQSSTTEGDETSVAETELLVAGAQKGCLIQGGRRDDTATSP